MKIAAFAVNKKQKRFFEKIKNSSKCSVEVLYSKKIVSFSFRALKYLKKMDFSPAVELRVKDFYSKYEIKLPEFLIRGYYKTAALFCYMRYFTKIKPEYEKIIIWNGFMFRQHIALEIAKLYGIKPVFVESAFLPGRIVVDPKGVNFLNSVPRDKEFYLNYKNDRTLPKELIPRQPKNAKKFSALKKEPLPERFVFVPFQVDYDTQILLFSPWVKNMRHLFYVLKDIANELQINIVFKEHPSSRKEYPDLHEIAKKDKYVSFANAYPTQELIEKSEAVITVNSSVGVESLLFYKKVITLGDAFYNIDGVVKHASSKEELVDILKNLKSWKIDKKLVENFLKYLYWDYLIPGSFEDNNEEQIKKIEEIICA